MLRKLNFEKLVFSFIGAKFLTITIHQMTQTSAIQ